MHRKETVQVLGRDRTLATFVTNLSQNIINPGTPGTDKASSVKACMLLIQLTALVLKVTRGTREHFTTTSPLLLSKNKDAQILYCYQGDH